MICFHYGPWPGILWLYLRIPTDGKTFVDKSLKAQTLFKLLTNPYFHYGWNIEATEQCFCSKIQWASLKKLFIHSQYKWIPCQFSEWIFSHENKLHFSFFNHGYSREKKQISFYQKHTNENCLINFSSLLFIHILALTVVALM